MKKGLLLLLMLLACATCPVSAQETVTEVADTLYVEAPDSTVQAVITAANVISVPDGRIQMGFKPNPGKATLLAIVPGLGQIYNRKYWKLPIVYGAFMGCFYAINWNNSNYVDYRDAYIDIMSVNPEENRSWADFIPGGASMTIEEQNTYINNSSHISRLKSGKDRFRKYRDLSIIVSVLVYGISIIDAYVDAQLFDFDISPELTMRVEPVYTPQTSMTPRTYGLNWSLTF